MVIVRLNRDAVVWTNYNNNSDYNDNNNSNRNSVIPIKPWSRFVDLGIQIFQALIKVDIASVD